MRLSVPRDCSTADNFVSLVAIVISIFFHDIIRDWLASHYYSLTANGIGLVAIVIAIDIQSII